MEHAHRRRARLCVAFSLAMGWAVLTAPFAAADRAVGWGCNIFGQVGDGRTLPVREPVPVRNLGDAFDLDGGSYHSLSVRFDGTAWAWGLGLTGQLGNGTRTSQQRSPVQVSNLTAVAAVSGGGEFSLALLANGTVWAWGCNDHGQLGNGQAGPGKEQLVPVQVIGLSNIFAISAGGSHAFAIEFVGYNADGYPYGNVWAWGWNRYGQLGNGLWGEGQEESLPVQVLSGIIAVSAGGGHSLAVTMDGMVLAWGRNNRGQIGIRETSELVPTPAAVYRLDRDMIDVAAGGPDDLGFSLALRDDGTVWVWGCNDYGQLGDGQGGLGKQRTEPIQVSALTDIFAIAAGDRHALAVQFVDLAADGRPYGDAWAWGGNNHSQLGDNSTADRLEPVQVHGSPGPVLHRVLHIAAGDYHSFTLLVNVPPQPPPSVSASDGTFTNCVRVQWTKPAGVTVTSYDVYRNTIAHEGSAMRIAANVPETTQPSFYDDTGAAPLQVYYYWVKAQNAAGESDFSPTDTGYRGQAPAAPSGISASDGTFTDRVRVTWQGVALTLSDGSPVPTTYTVYSSLTNNTQTAQQIASGVAGTSYDDTSAAPGTTYWYWVTATNPAATSGFSPSDDGYRAWLATVHVDDTNTTGNEDGSVAHPFNTIQEALDAVGPNGTVKVARGTYWQDLHFNGRRATVKGGYLGATSYPGTGDFSDASRNPNPATNQTVLDGGGAPRQITAVNASGSALESFSIRNGGATSSGGVVLKRVIVNSGP